MKMGIQKKYLIPECFIMKLPMCDDCEVELLDTGTQYATYPPQLVYKCPKCNKEYVFNVNEIQGEWKWRTI